MYNISQMPSYCSKVDDNWLEELVLLCKFGAISSMRPVGLSASVIAELMRTSETSVPFAH